jgi:hypothetical protein
MKIPGGNTIAKRYKQFKEQLPKLKQEMQLGGRIFPLSSKK